MQGNEIGARARGRRVLAALGVTMMAWSAVPTGAKAAEPSAPSPRVDFAVLDTLPAPVARYFRRVLTDHQPMFREARFRQAGTVRTSTATENWMDFTATETMSQPAPGFTWDARVSMMPLVYVRVLDAYQDGIGQGQVRLWSLIPMGSDKGTPQMNAGALHRYLAEAVWFPVALLPRDGLRWSPIDDRRALATLSDRGVTVSLEFRFNDRDEVETVYTDARWGGFDGGYKQVPWEGHFRDYFVQDGMRLPRYGEVGWYDAGDWRAVWKGNVVEAAFAVTP